MARFFSFIVSLFVLCHACLTLAAPIGARQLFGGLGCNIARLQTVGGLRRTIREVNQLAGLTASDAAASSAVSTAQAALESAQGGIRDIASALFSGDAPPQAARDVVEQGFNDAKQALTSITTTDPSVTQKIAEAQEDLDKTIVAGGKVVSRCGNAE